MSCHTDKSQELFKYAAWVKNTNWFEFRIKSGGTKSDVRHKKDFKLLESVIQRKNKVDGIKQTISERTQRESVDVHPVGEEKQRLYRILYIHIPLGQHDFLGAA